MNVWDRVKENIQRGTVIDDKYRVSEVDDKGFTMVRLSSKKPVRITRKLVESVHQRLFSGERLAKQANQTQGGVSYTIAIEAGVIASLGSLVRYIPEERVFVRSRASSRKTG